MNYLICQDWYNTSGNHAGIKHMCNLLTSKYPNEYKSVYFKDLLLKNKYKRFIYSRFILPVLYTSFAIKLAFTLRKNDRIFLLEYLDKTYPQYYIACTLKLLGKSNMIYGLIHLTPIVFTEHYKSSYVKKVLKPLNKILTLGSSLTKFIQENNYKEKNDIITLFHYVDLEFYSKSKEISSGNPFNIIIMGCQKRNFDKIYNIIKNCKDCHFILCRGYANIKNEFFELPNIEIHGYISEIDLKKLMDSSAVSLNVMDDTIGSNVIVTSLAMGLAMVVSDVGSIRDYCNENNSLFCDSEEEFVSAIRYLKKNPNILQTMRENSQKLALQFNISHFHNLICNI